MPYVGAPYNFVPFSKSVLRYPKEGLPAHDSAEEFYSGEISYKLTALSDIFVGGGEKIKDTDSFFRDSYGRYALPGSTMRGLIRDHVQVLSLSEMGQDIDGDYALMYRNIANGAETKRNAEKKRYADLLGAGKNVEAGYIEKADGKYRIYRPLSVNFGSSYGRMNYYILSEVKIARSYEKGSKDFEFFFPANGTVFTQHDCRRPFFSEGDGKRKHNKGTENAWYQPYAKKCYYRAGGKDILSVKAENAPGYLEGYAVSTGKMQEKKAIYILPALDWNQPYLEISPERVKAFQVDFEKRRTTLKTLPFGKKVKKEDRDVELFNLPKEGERKPVFFITDGKRKDGKEEVLNFGFTPRLRLLYDYKIKDGIPMEHRSGELDYASALFGYSKENKAYKSRVSFTDAVLENEEMFGEKFSYIPGEPKPTSYLDYLEQEDGKATTYNTDHFQLRGTKQYWLRDQEKQALPSEKLGEVYVSHFLPLASGRVFGGKVRFHNLKKEELGLLLWAMTLEKGSQMNLGKAKAYGFGKVRLDVLHVRSMDDQAAYSMKSLPSLSVWRDEEISVAEMVQAYKQSLKEFLGRRPESDASIATFLKMKNPEIKPDNDKTRYMSIDAREYQVRMNEMLPLDRPEKLLKPKDGEYAAEVIAVENKRAVKFRLLDESTVYGKLKREDILFVNIDKSQMEETFPKGTLINVIRGADGRWKCVGHR